MPGELKECRFSIACDVKNPLCGKNGAVYVFGPQKGVKEEDKQRLDKKMMHFADKTKEFTGTDFRMAEGAGAAGGLGFAFLSYFPNAELKSGIDIVLEAIRLEQEVKSGVTKDAGECNAAGIDAFFPIVRGVTTLDEAMNPENAKENMALSVEQVFRAIMY